MKRSLLATVLAVAAAPVLGQDPLVVAPQAYKLRFENAWVRVVRVYYAPHELVVAHDHTPTSTAYVYLNDSGPVVFNHLDKDYGAVTRKPTKTGSFRLYYGLQEVHEVSNTSDLPSEFLRVEFKTEPTGEARLKGTFSREPIADGESFQKLHFENEQIRIHRLIWPSGAKMQVRTTATEPALIVALTDPRSSVTLRAKGRKTSLNLSPGQSNFVEAGQDEEWENAGKTAIEVLRFDFKTPPLSKEELDKRSGKHTHAKG